MLIRVEDETDEELADLKRNYEGLRDAQTALRARVDQSTAPVGVSADGGRSIMEEAQRSPRSSEVGLVSVNVGLPGVIGASRWGKPIRSSIVKRPVTAASISLDALNLEGDRQADLTVHGGPDKAVYAYPVEHLPTWNEELGTDFGPGTFGENLTTAGWLEDEVRIGDVWAWGQARLQVSQPRSPCYKLAKVTSRPDLLKRFVRTGRTGWYLRVLQVAIVPVSGPIQVIERHPAGISVLLAHRASLPGALDRSEVKAVARVDALAADWRHLILHQLDPG
jgi:MOSC domain-containing protein YiiM